MPNLISSATFSVDTEKRVIKGRILPFGEVSRLAATPSGSAHFMFSAGSVELPENASAVRLNYQHDTSIPIGVATALEEREDGIYGTFRVANTPRADEILTLAAEGALTAFSVGVDGTFKAKGDVQHAQKTYLTETSVVVTPAFTGAEILSVAASAAEDTKENEMLENTPEVAPEGVTFSAEDVKAAVADGIEAAFASDVRIPVAQTQVKEELPYRFNGGTGAHCFSADIFNQHNDSDAATRLNKFLNVAFANVATTDVDELNPIVTRPELYVDNLHYSRPLWNLVSTGTLDDVTSFVIPKFAAKSGLVGAHTQGTEPTEGAISTTSQTVNPAAVSGKVILNREVLDQKGNPALDGIIWSEMVVDYYSNIEVKIAAALAAANAAGEVNLSTTAADYALVNALKQNFALKQFVAGGDRFSAFAAAPSLYTALVAAKDGNNQPLLPMYGATNTDGSKRASLESVQVGAKTVTPAWALDNSTDNAELSFLFVPSSVYAWASAPKRIDIEAKVSSVEIGIWGYSVAAVTRNTDVIPFDMTSADA